MCNIVAVCHSFRHEESCLKDNTLSAEYFSQGNLDFVQSQLVYAHVGFLFSECIALCSLLLACGLCLFKNKIILGVANGCCGWFWKLG